VVVLQRLQTCSSIINGHELAVAPALASQAEPLVVREVFGHVDELMIQAFLRSDDVRIALPDNLPDRRTPVGP
jgi:hypothetical protein